MTALAVEQVPINAATAQRSWFEQLPMQVYTGNSFWSPASDSVVTQAFADADEGIIEMYPVVVVRSGRAVARAAAMLRPFGVKQEDNSAAGWLGLIECVPEERDAGYLAIEACCRWLRERGRTEVVAPQASELMSGLLVGGFDRPQTILTPYNPQWYAELLSTCGFSVTGSMVALEFSREHVPRFFGRVDSRVQIRRIDTRRLPEELETIRRFQHDTFADSPAHLDRTPEQMQRLVERLGEALDPDLVVIAEDRDGEVVGVLVCLSDAWQPRPVGSAPDRARILTIGVAPKWRGKGVAVAMGRELTGILLQKGYRNVEASWVRQENRRPQVVARALGARETRRFALYTRHLADARI
jgi:ribosomal protein S18 acetylase RimI-like enzyme